MNIYICLFAALCPLIYGLTTPLMGCYHEGKYYQEGSQFQPTPCEHCFCNHGRAVCAIADCFITPCVDPVHDPTMCCAVCPNGSNCYAGNQIIPAGQSVQINEHTTCKCPTRFGFGMTLHRAECSTTVNSVTANVVN